MTTVLFIHQSAELYGSDKTLLTFLERFDRNKFKPVVILPYSGPLLDELLKLEIKVVVAPVLKVYRQMFSPKNIFHFIRQKKEVLKILNKLNEEYRFDVIYSNTLAVLSGMIFARKKGIRHIWHVHEIIVHPKPIAALYPYLLKKFADTIICNSYATKDNLVKRISALKSKTVVVYNGLDSQYCNTTVVEKLPTLFPEKGIVITLVGRISRLKGHKWLLDTYCSYLKSTNVRLLFVGSPVSGQEHYLEEILDVIHQQHLEEKVKILPFTKNLAPVWHATDIAIMPSTEAESFGLVALEAMLAKKPVVAANHGGLTEIVIDNETGYLVEPGNNEMLATALKKLAGDAALRKKFGESGQLRAMSHFSVNNYVAQISRILSA